MSLVITFEERKREKQLKYERILLRELSIQALRTSVLLHFGAVKIGSSPWLNESLEGACIDVAIEAFLTGGEVSRFAVYGEGIDQIRRRCTCELSHYTDTLYHFWLYWDFDQSALREDSILLACKNFIDHWWEVGYEKGIRRHKLRLN